MFENKKIINAAAVLSTGKAGICRSPRAQMASHFFFLSTSNIKKFYQPYILGEYPW